MVIKSFKDLTLSNIVAYIQGNIRYKLWYSKNKFFNKQRFIRKHIREQIEFRIRFMNRTCYMQGSCVKCGCNTTALQMANKACDAPCYPIMMNKAEWNSFINGKSIHRDETGTWIYYPKGIGTKADFSLAAFKEIQGFVKKAGEEIEYFPDIWWWNKHNKLSECPQKMIIEPQSKAI